MIILGAVDQAILTAVLTLSGAVILFAISEFSRGLFITPILALRAHIGEIVDRVILYSADLTSGADIDTARKKLVHEALRATATQLRAKEQMLPFYGLWSLLKLVPNATDIDTCAKQLIGLSNSFTENNGPDGKPTEYYQAYCDANIKRIRLLQDSLALRSEIVPRE